MLIKIDLRPILFITRRTDGSVGEHWSTPWHYFRRQAGASFPLEVHVPGGGLRSRLYRKFLRHLRDNARAVIIGGGGLIGNELFKTDLEFWSDGPAPAVLWGVGHNSDDIDSVPERGPDALGYTQIVPFGLIGLRDWGSGYAWVPCASCMHPGLNRSTRPTDGATLFVLHRDLKQKREAIDKVLKHAPSDHQIVFNDAGGSQIFDAIRRAKQVVTNSYHAAYWSTLLCRPVVVIGGGTKIKTLKHKPVIATAGDWADRIKECEVFPEALDECRDRNSEFSNVVFQEFIPSARKAGSAAPLRQPLLERKAESTLFGGEAPGIVRNRVPKVIHFIFGLSPDFGGKPFNLMHYFAVLSAAQRIRPEAIYFHHAYEPSNEYYSRVKGLMISRKCGVPTEIFGRELKHFAHRADVLRMQLLQEFGGIYLDLDTVSVKPFDDLLTSSFSIGLQGRDRVFGLCNAVMLSAPRDRFIQDWLEYYRQFTPEVWDRFSVKLPYAMWRSGKHKINVLAYDIFHWPLWDNAGLDSMFQRDQQFPNALCHHLWESMSYKKHFVDRAFSDAVEALKRRNSTYLRLVREFI
jgi:hypothetical protein